MSLIIIRISIYDIIFDLNPVMWRYDDQFFLILFIVIKVRITLVLQCVYIITQSVIWKGSEKK